MGFVFQFFNLIPTLTAKENVQFALELAGRDGGEPAHSAVELLEQVGLERVNHFPSQLSGGEQQRVAVARALAKDPALILGDEPTGNLDYRTGKLVLSALLEVSRDEGKTVIGRDAQPAARAGSRPHPAHPRRPHRRGRDQREPPAPGRRGVVT